MQMTIFALNNKTVPYSIAAKSSVSEVNPSHAVHNICRVRHYPPWLLFATFVVSVGYPRYNPQKTCKQLRMQGQQFHWL